MKRVSNYIFVCFIMIIISCGSEKTSENGGGDKISTDLITNPVDSVGKGKMAEISFDEKEYDFGKVEEGEKVKHTYKFKNTGETPLIISSAKASCGCTVPEWPADPIGPGETGKIDVVFDSEGRPGKQEKAITIIANTEPNTLYLKLTGEVIKRKE